MEMNSELHHARQIGHQHLGAGSATSVIAFPGRDVMSHSASRSASASAESAPVTVGQAALFGAQLHLSSPRNACTSVASSRISHRRIAVKSPRSSSRPSVPVQSFPLSNNRLVPTTQRYAPLGPRAVGAVAAQPKRYVAIRIEVVAEQS
jgi:hypothetical protein